MPFRDVVGHPVVLDMLRRSIARNALPPSLLFTGPSGVGKATTALALAEVLNCERRSGGGSGTPAALDACGECPTCQRLERASAMFRTGRERPAIDCLQWLEPDDKASIKIEPVRAVLGRAAYRPLDGRCRVVIIDEAQDLEVPAQQALLKMLEEPPASTSFVLVTAQPDALAVTIRSRCPRLRFGPLSTVEIAGALVQRHGWASSDAQAAAAMAGGRLGDAISRGNAAGQEARRVAAEVLEGIARGRSPNERLKAAQALVARGGARGRGASASRQDILVRLDALAVLLRDLGILGTGADRRALANVDLSSRLELVAPVFGGDRLSRGFALVDRARAAIGRNASQKIVGDWLALNL